MNFSFSAKFNFGLEFWGMFIIKILYFFSLSPHVYSLRWQTTDGATKRPTLNTQNCHIMPFLLSTKNTTRVSKKNLSGSNIRLCNGLRISKSEISQSKLVFCHIIKIAKKKLKKLKKKDVGKNLKNAFFFSKSTDCFVFVWYQILFTLHFS